MTLIDFIVRVYVGGTVDVPSIGLASGVCEWSTADMTLDILSDSWATSFRKSVDTTVSGNEQRYDDSSVQILKTANVETTLRNNGLTIIGARVEVFETDGTNEYLMHRGIVRSIPEEGNNVVLDISNVANYYQTNMSRRVGDTYQPLFYGDSSAPIELERIEGKDYSDITFGNNLIPACTVVQQSDTWIDLAFVYSTSTATEAVIREYMESAEYYLISNDTPLVGVWDGLVRGFIVDGPRNGVRIELLPLNLKDSVGDYVIPDGQTVTIELTDYTQYLYPYGSEVSTTSIQYEVNGRFFPYPFYVDSRIDESDRLRVLDADGQGDEFVAPLGGNATIAEDVPSIVEVSILSGMEYYGDGIWYENNAFVDIDNVVGFNLDEYGKRDSLNLPQTAVSISMADNQSNQDMSFARTTQYVVKMDKDRLLDELYYTANSLLFSELESTDGYDNAKIEVQFWISTPNLEQRTFDFQDTFNTPSALFKIIENLLPSEVSNSSGNELYRLEGGGINDYNGKGIRVFDSSLSVEGWEKTVGITILMVQKITYNNVDTPDTGGTPVTGTITFASQDYVTSPVSIPTDNLYTAGASGREDISGGAITTTDNTYTSALQLQNYETVGVSKPSEGWGLEYPVDDLSGVIDPAISTRSYELQYTPESSNTKDVKYDMLKYTFGVGHLDSLGRESWSDVLGMYGSLWSAPVDTAGQGFVMNYIYPDDTYQLQIDENNLQSIINRLNSDSGSQYQIELSSGETLTFENPVFDSKVGDDVYYDVERVGGTYTPPASVGESVSVVSFQYSISIADTLASFTKREIQGVPSIARLDTTRVYCDIGVTYAGGAISITNTEQEAWDGSAGWVTGIEGDNGRLLWEAGSLLYKKYGVKTPYPSTLGNISGIRDNEDAQDYIANQYRLFGANVDFANSTVTLYDRFRVKFNVPRSVVFGIGLELGSIATFSYPNITTSPVKGIVTDLTNNIQTGVTSITLDCLGDVLASTEEDELIETGSQPEDVTETGTQTEDIVEVF